ncbi:MAG: alpha-hydroxy-acid oxidizing protein, partial [Rhizobiaceae bacterium]
GARFVFLGRPFMFALAAAGGAGVRHAFSILKAETARDMAMMGINRPEEMAARHIRAAP